MKSPKRKSPLPGGPARRNKLLVSWGPLVIAPPLAGSGSLACDALHRASADAERSGDLQDTHTFRKLPSHLPLGRAVDLRATEFHALGDRALEPSFDTLADHRPLKLGKGARHLENELAHRRGRVDGLLI